MKRTCLTVDKHSKFMTFGVEVNGDLWIIDINFINNDHFWGLCIGAPVDDGDAVNTITAKVGDDLMKELKIDDKKITIRASEGVNSYSVLIVEE